MSNDTSTERPMLWELWEFDGGHSFIAHLDDDAVYRHGLEQALAGETNVRMTWTVAAVTYNEAMQTLYDHQGYGRYRTIEEELGETDPIK